jgi:hypothetical protein
MPFSKYPRSSGDIFCPSVHSNFYQKRNSQNEREAVGEEDSSPLMGEDAKT